MAESAGTSPMMRQYHRIKASYPDAILFFRLGDFYEMFFEDAELASEVLDITLTARHRGTPNEAPMCGVPHHSADGYLARLLAAGHKVAIAEQVEDAATTKGMVRREVVRVLTPGTLVEDGMLEARRHNYLVAVTERSGTVGVAALDVSTGDFVAAEFDGDTARARARDEISRWAPREVCFPEGQEPRAWLQPVASGGATVDITTWSGLPAWTFDASRADARLREHFGVVSMDGFDLAGQAEAIGAAGALLYYAGEQSQMGALRHVHSIRRYRDRDVLQLDDSTRRSLELVESWQAGTRAGSLLAVIDRTATAMGGRRLREWLLRPLVDVAAIRGRHELVAELVDDVVGRDGLRRALREVHDLERLVTRIVLGSATPRDLGALRASLRVLPDVRTVLSGAARVSLGVTLAEAVDPCDDVLGWLDEALVDEPPAAVTAGGVMREGFDAELDRLRELRARGKGFIAELEAAERQRTGIGSLKVRYNKVFGYFIEVSKANLEKVPETYIRKQTLANAERFVTPELKEHEESVLGAEERQLALESKLFGALRERVGGQAERLRSTADALASLDVLASLAEVAARGGWVRPQVDDDDVLEVRGGRHPIVEALQPDLRFVPNDAFLDGHEHRIQLVTGPNMGGKSTYLRQIALTVIMAQMGGFVPARGAHVGVVDRIFTRVGASDNLARGASTFLVEMQETANILNSATPRSLILLDEVGRGTSTYDGLSIAWAVVEYLHDQPHLAARTLFATHYHELTVLADQLSGLGNLHVAVHESGDGVVFLHEVQPGAADRSYGIHVGRLAGLPEAVVERARELLAELEGDRAAPVRRREATTPSAQLALFAPPEHPLLRQLRQLDTDAMTPLQALELLSRWRRDLDS